MLHCYLHISVGTIRAGRKSLLALPQTDPRHVEATIKTNAITTKQRLLKSSPKATGFRRTHDTILAFESRRFAEADCLAHSTTRATGGTKYRPSFADTGFRPGKLGPGNDPQMDFIGPIEKAQGASPRPKRWKTAYRASAHGASLHRPVDDAGLQPGGDDLDGGEHRRAPLNPSRSILLRRLEHQQPCLIDLYPRLGDPGPKWRTPPDACRTLS